MKLRAFIIGSLFGLTVLAAALVPLTTLAQGMTLAYGQTLSHALNVCLSKDDAIAIVKADEAGGAAAGSALFLENARCSPVSVAGPKVGRVVYSAKVKRGDADVVMRVIEIISDGKAIGYFFFSGNFKEVAA